METVKTHSRRSFISSTSQLLSGAWLASHWPDVADAAHHAEAATTSNEPPKYTALAPEEVTQVDAISALIIPSGATPGAREAHVTVFVDRAVGTFLAGMAPMVHAGLKEFGESFKTQYPDAKGFATAKPEQQAAFISAMEQSPFFQVMRLLTVLGYLASPKYGGNANGIGWKAIGFDDQHMFQPPFGYYDREYTGFVPYDIARS
jgi:gluconate 2-dehydrogenase gamma chain